MKNARQLAKERALEEQIKRLAKDCKLDSWNSFVENMTVPTDIYAALMTNRPELLKACPPRELNKEECAALYGVLAGLMQTNAALREHAQDLAHFVDTWGSAFKQLHSVGNRIQRFANFRAQDENDDDGEEAA